MDRPKPQHTGNFMKVFFTNSIKLVNIAPTEYRTIDLFLAQLLYSSLSLSQVVFKFRGTSVLFRAGIFMFSCRIHRIHAKFYLSGPFGLSRSALINWFPGGPSPAPPPLPACAPIFKNNLPPFASADTPGDSFWRAFPFNPLPSSPTSVIN